MLLILEFPEIPEPEIVTSLMKAARRLNDYAMTVRILEMVKFKCTYNPIAFCYIMQEIEPVLTELGINSLEELGYDKPELYMEDTHFH
uniref:Cytochrome c oxidase subunit 5A, mitochondrial n=1 Tax=Ceratosolen solmsi TaxID=142686 RepID=A0A0A1CN20_9HYME|nr:mitochondrial cytochrome c oxidase polypeptide Va [Ceratosolen solmsi]